MPDVNLSQAEADAFISIEKYRIDNKRYNFPYAGGVIEVPLQTVDKREQFVLDIRRGRIDMGKCTYQNRVRQVVILVRLDLGNAPHRNPDGQEVPPVHIHIYRENFGDKWAYPVPRNKFTDITNLSQTLNDFMTYCNVVEPPFIDQGLFD